MKAALRVLGKFLRDDRGLETVEYAIITGLIVAGVIATIASIGGWVYDKFNALDTSLSGTTP